MKPRAAGSVVARRWQSAAHARRGALLAAAVLLAPLHAVALAQPAAGEAGARADTDGDGVADGLDHCPAAPGLAADGCPPRDEDGDGLLDALDACPALPGPWAMRGCPDTDADDDGLADRVDQCPAQPGDEAWGGCPAKDSDLDGVPDDFDRCPASKEVWNGNRDGDGCSDRGRALGTFAPATGRLRAALTVEGNPPSSARWAAVLGVAATFSRVQRLERLDLVIIPAHHSSLGAALDHAARWRASAELAVARAARHGLAAQVRSTFPGEPPGLFIQAPAGSTAASVAPADRRPL